MECKNCKKELIINRGQNQKQFCSKECGNKFRYNQKKEDILKQQKLYRKLKSKENPNWKKLTPASIELQRWLLELKSKPCTDCGNYFDSCCMDFDHLEPSLKTCDIAHLFSRCCSKERISKELEKCELVCSNCHRIRTKDRNLILF